MLLTRKRTLSEIILHCLPRERIGLFANKIEEGSDEVKTGYNRFDEIQTVGPVRFPYNGKSR